MSDWVKWFKFTMHGRRSIGSNLSLDIDHPTRLRCTLADSLLRGCQKSAGSVSICRGLATFDYVGLTCSIHVGSTRNKNQTLVPYLKWIMTHVSHDREMGSLAHLKVHTHILNASNMREANNNYSVLIFFLTDYKQWKLVPKPITWLP